MPEWKRLLIQKTYIVYPNALATELDAKRNLLIATDEKRLIKNQEVVGWSQQ